MLTELVLHSHHHFDMIERVQTQIVDEMRVGFELMAKTDNIKSFDLDNDCLKRDAIKIGRRF